MKKIALLATGGTIACTQTENGLMPTLCASDLIDIIKDRLPCEVVSKDVFRLDSSNMQPEEWRTLATETYEALKTCDGVVITHGTDTMAYTASMLSYMLCGVPKPVIITGSQLPITHSLSDAGQNLLGAITAAAMDENGVYVLFDRKIISGVRAVKTHTTSMDAFSSVNAPKAGHIDSEGVHFDLMQPPCPLDYQLRTALDTGVTLIKLMPGMSPDMLDFVRKANYRGLVLEAFGLGGLHYIRRNLVGALSELAHSGVHVLVVSQCLYEKADLSVYEVGREMMMGHVHSGRDMTTEAAVTKLMWALGQNDPEELLSLCIAGEFQ